VLGGRPKGKVVEEVKETDTGEMSAFINRMCAHIVATQEHDDKMMAYRRMTGRYT
jgi:hypothetical protein